MRACGLQHEPLGAHPVESHLHQGIAAHGPHAQDHPLAEGAVPLEDVKAAISADLLTSKQDTLYNDTLTQWATQANAKINEAGMN